MTSLGEIPRRDLRLVASVCAVAATLSVVHVACSPTVRTFMGSGGSGLAPGSGGGPSGSSSSGGTGGGNGGTSTAATMSSGATSSSATSSSATSSASSTTTSSGSTSSSGGATGPNCQGLPSTCGAAGNESSCASEQVSGGMFLRGYDGVTYMFNGNPATVSDFDLDRFEVTAGRFRAFVAAWIGNWRPAAGAGKHTQLNGGMGLNGGMEPGWDTSWNASLPTDQAGWDQDLTCNGSFSTWAGSNQNLPMNCIDWYEAYAFCIYDGGFLPTDAESNYAASGGNQQRSYPWSSPATAQTIDGSYAVYDNTPLVAVGSDSPKGDGLWNQADLSGSVAEWILDWSADADINPCTDCAQLTAGSNRVVRGGGWDNPASYLFSAVGNAGDPTVRTSDLGVRCARIPN
jgi:sulfatase modifying factor 1